MDAAVSFKWYEVAKFWSATDHIFETAAWYFSDKIWQSLTPADREMFRKAAIAGGEVMTKAGEEIDRQGIETLKVHSVSYTVPDVAAFREALKDVHKNFEGKVYPVGLVDKIRALQN